MLKRARTGRAAPVLQGGICELVFGQQVIINDAHTTLEHPCDYLAFGAGARQDHHRLGRDMVNQIFDLSVALDGKEQVLV